MKNEGIGYGIVKLGAALACVFTLAACTEEEKEAFKNAVVDRAKCEGAKAAYKEKLVSQAWYDSAVKKCAAAGIKI